ncbi:DNA cytosine methyltransferase [Streptomyces sp. NBC_01142]|uniref:DNA cytosine methyltransferase n=1 Tax=Streptomyces sp. NBC_01142 TaxID=2975865 RepID=UPI00225552A8|nr:DNA cytosine methyltransferase [Streptomyces sp. NBC_01142]MCX4826336.1 DNA cytosine methyltransferase [Streptomyces sp. NBC_01142]
MSEDAARVEIVDLFGGPGGWDVAATQLGLSVTGIEHDHAACETRRAAGLDTVEGDVRAYSPSDFPTATDLIGSPPCQPYSIGGKGAGRRALDTVLHFASQLAARKDIRAGLATLDDERTGLVLEPLRWVLEALDTGRPYRTVMLEQVPTVLPVWDSIAAILRCEGYTVVTGRLHAEEYGVPQTRARAVLVARRHDEDDEAVLPAPTHRRYARSTDQDGGNPDLLPWVSMAQALGWGMTHRPALTVAVGTAAGGPDPSCVGGSGSRATLYGERDAGRWIADTRLVDADSLPAYRGGRKDMIRVSVADAAALQTFPPTHPFQGTRTKQYEQVGNAMPPVFAEAVIRRAMAPQLAARPGAQAA